MLNIFQKTKKKHTAHLPVINSYVIKCDIFCTDKAEKQSLTSPLRKFCVVYTKMKTIIMHDNEDDIFMSETSQVSGLMICFGIDLIICLPTYWRFHMCSPVSSMDYVTDDLIRQLQLAFVIYSCVIEIHESIDKMNEIDK